MLRVQGGLVSDEATERLGVDLQRVRLLRIGRVPTIVVQTTGSRIAAGYRPIDAMEQRLAIVSA